MSRLQVFHVKVFFHDLFFDLKFSAPFYGPCRGLLKKLRFFSELLVKSTIELRSFKRVETAFEALGFIDSNDFFYVIQLWSLYLGYCPPCACKDVSNMESIELRDRYLFK